MNGQQSTERTWAEQHMGIVIDHASRGPMEMVGICRGGTRVRMRDDYGTESVMPTTTVRTMFVKQHAGGLL